MTTSEVSGLVGDRSLNSCGSWKSVAPPWSSSKTSQLGFDLLSNTFDLSAINYRDWVTQSLRQSLSLRKILKRATNEKGSSSSLTWRTPTTMDAEQAGGKGRMKRRGKVTLHLQADQWPSPNARDHKGQDIPGRHGGASLSHAVETGEFSHQPPTIQPGPQSAKPLRTSNQKLNPAFVCWLMGFPWFWTRVEPISYAAQATESYHFKQRLLLRSFLNALESFEDKDHLMRSLTISSP
jgi:hypothetical protein